MRKTSSTYLLQIPHPALGTLPDRDLAAYGMKAAGGAGEAADEDAGVGVDVHADAGGEVIQMEAGTTMTTATMTTLAALRRLTRRGVRGTDRAPDQALQTYNRATRGTGRGTTSRRGFGHSWTTFLCQTNSPTRSTPHRIPR